MPIDVRREIAQRALDLVGVPYKLGGRCPLAGLDCIGVVALALAGHIMPDEVPRDYTLRGEYLDRISAFFDRAHFQNLGRESMESGDLLLCQTGPRQLHMAILTDCGVVHAHAGLRRVVLTPLPLPWPLVGRWRVLGE